MPAGRRRPGRTGQGAHEEAAVCHLGQVGGQNNAGVEPAGALQENVSGKTMPQTIPGKGIVRGSQITNKPCKINLLTLILQVRMVEVGGSSRHPFLSS